METESLKPMVEFEQVVEQIDGLAPINGVNALVATVGPVAEKLATYKARSISLTITNDNDAAAAAAFREQMLTDCRVSVDAINGFMPDEQGVGLIARLNNAKNKLTGFRNLFSEIDSFAKTVKRKIGDYEDAKAREAEEERQRQQAKVDEAARIERERLEREAARLKTPEKKAERLEQAAAIVPPIIQTPQVQTTGTKFQTRTVVTKLDLIAMGVPREIAGYFKVEVHPDGRFKQAVLSADKLAQAKNANSMLEIKGVTFGKVRV